MSLSQWLQSVAELCQTGLPQVTRQPPFADLQPTVEWQVNGLCNYDCSYCIQSKSSRVGVPDERTIAAIVGQFAELPGQWEIKMSGGEPFAFKGFIGDVIPQLMTRTQHWVSVLTNFSAPLDILNQFCQLTGDRLRITSASFHSEFTEFSTFLKKAIAFRELRSQFNPHSSFVVNAVLVPGKVARHFEIRAKLAEAKLRYFPQLMKIRGGVYPYDAAETRCIEQLTDGSHDPRQVNRAPNYRGLPCEAGAWYFTVDKNGEAYSCRTGKRFLAANNRASLGNLVQGTFRLRSRGGPCPYAICPCTVPVNRGIVRLPADRLDVPGNTSRSGCDGD